MILRSRHVISPSVLGGLVLVLVAVTLGLHQPPVEITHAIGPTLDQVRYPRFFLYTGNTGNGWPLVSVTQPPGQCAGSGLDCRYKSDCNGASCSDAAPNPGSWDNPLVTATVNQFARFPLVVFPPTPASDRRTAIMTALKAANPNTKLIAYTIPDYQGCAIAYTQNDHAFSLSFWNLIKSIVPNPNPVDDCDYTGPARLWLQNGQIATTATPYDVNWSYHVVQPDTSVTYPLAEGMATVFFQELYQPHLFDGIFLDQFCSDISGTDNQLVTKIDYTRASYSSAAEFYAGWTAGQLVFANKLRALVTAAGGTDFPIIGNCGAGPTVALLVDERLDA